MAEVPPRYRSPYFLHIWGNGYEANYYAYMWGEILDDDAYEWFTENGGMTRQNGQAFRDKMLGRTYTADPMRSIAASAAAIRPPKPSSASAGLNKPRKVNGKWGASRLRGALFV